MTDGQNTPTSEELAADAWPKALLPTDATIQQAIKLLDETALQIVMIVSGDGRLIGTVTDGDIRRALLRGLELTSPIDGIIFRDPIVVPPQLGRETVLQLMQANKIHQLPVVDEGRKLVGLHVWDELMVPKTRPNTMVILAGGLGSRLRPLTDNCPKPMLPIGGKPMLEHIIERAKAEGFHRFVLAVHFLGHMIEEHFGDGSRWSVEIDYLREKSPLGTAGALSLLDPRPEEALLVSNGDVLTNVRYAELLDFHTSHRAAATMAVRLHEWQHPFGVVRTKGVDIIGFEEKPLARTHINAGVYALEPSALGALKPGEHVNMPDLFARLQESGARTIVYPMHEPWLDVGQADDLRLARENYSTDT